MGMTATERLRALLTERGVEWETDRSGNRVMWGRPVDPFHDTMEFKAVDNALPNGGLNVHICGFTPEQAIAATLGSYNCSSSERTETCEYCANGKFDGQTVMMSNHGWQRINFCPNCGRKVVDE